MKKFIYSALVAIVAIGAVQSAKAVVFLADGTPVPCSTNLPLNCAARTGIPGDTPVEDQDGAPIGTISQYSFDQAD